MMRIAFILIFTIPSFAVAQIVKCGDTWTNGNCDTTPGAALNEKPFEEQKKDFRLASLKRSLLHDFTTARLDARKHYDIQVSSTYVDEICTDPSSSLEKCREAIDREESKLLERVKVAQEKEAKELEEENRRKQVSEERNSVVVQDIDNYWLRRYGRPNRWPPDTTPYRPGVKPREPSNFTAPSINRNTERTPNPQLGNQ